MNHCPHKSLKAVERVKKDEETLHIADMVHSVYQCNVCDALLFFPMTVNLDSINESYRKDYAP